MKVEDKSDMTIFENERLTSRLKELKEDVLDLCGKFKVYNK
jgi:hypothetical protein